jgi:tRNA threonylcarbamoyladenosine biosynthesis protein TsaE
VGDLGAGKTLFVQALAQGLDVPPEVRVTSPTFTLINDYPGGRLPLFHADLYRIERAAELAELGFDDLIEGDGVLAIEWSDRFDVLPEDHLALVMTVETETTRSLVARARGPRSRELLAAWVEQIRP